MSELIVVGFDNELKADEVLHKLGDMQKEHLVDLDDAVVVIKNEKGKVKVKQSYDLVTSGALSGGFWGSLIGLLFLHPLLGVAAGLATGALSGALTDVGVDDEFIKDLGKTIEPSTSALFLLVRKATPDKVLEELRPYGGKLLRTSLSKSDEASLKAALEKAKVEA
ncbi:DUF1269 domain-containing protein [Pleurocapsa sp. FMAR1]|uniref:DUF1269 domain-containing protein n=1 Tax=Pleurocapsa sp. FMAR1 TaxID=3040204 RepID=UPI0029C84B21|nr:DUF1269 domain-containing protein [Pleurocapsa sp. FMAR1]